MSFVQALLSMGYRPVPLAGAPSEKVVDIAIQRTLAALADRDDDVLLVSNDGDFLEGVEELLDGRRRVGVVGFTEFRNHEFIAAGRARARASSTWSTTSRRSPRGCRACGSSRSTSSTRSSSSDPSARQASSDTPADRPASSRATGTRNGEQDT